tara:strand:+ start:200 stop:775 length:576 start_codon:yes stop_codon:yes gene_type:complete
MDKTTTWLVRSASLIVIIFGIGYVSTPLGNKLKQLTALYKESQTLTNIRGIVCSDSEEILNESDNEILNLKESINYRFFDKRNGELYLYDKESNSIYKHLNYLLIRSKEDVDIYAQIGYVKDSFLYVDETLLVEGEQTNRKPFFKVNLKTLKIIPLNEIDESSLLQYRCRNIQLPNDTEIISAEKISFEEI